MVQLIVGTDVQADALEVNQMTSVENNSLIQKCDSDHDDCDRDVIGAFYVFYFIFFSV